MRVQFGQNYQIMAVCFLYYYLSVVLILDGLTLYTVDVRHVHSPHSRTINWKATGYGALRSLGFNKLGTKLVAVSDKHLHVLPFSELMVSQSVSQLDLIGWKE